MALLDYHSSSVKVDASDNLDPVVQQLHPDIKDVE
jgi:hypothetical protein